MLQQKHKNGIKINEFVSLFLEPPLCTRHPENRQP